MAVNVSANSLGSRGRFGEKQKCRFDGLFSSRCSGLQNQGKTSKILSCVTDEVKPGQVRNAAEHHTVTCVAGFQSCVL